MAATKLRKKRDEIPGLNDERGDSIVGGGLGIETLMEALEARRSAGLGPGRARGPGASAPGGRTLPAAAEVREASVRALAARFARLGRGSRPRAAPRVADAALQRACEPRAIRRCAEAAPARAACVLDIGRSVDFFDRHEHAADIVLATELCGFSHREIALALRRPARGGRRGRAGRAARPAAAPEDREASSRAAVLLALADDIEERCPRGAALELDLRGAEGRGAW